MRFFIDYTADDQSLYDYHGEEFLSSNDALDFAEATVQTLKNDLAGLWQGWSVHVRSADGKTYFSLPIHASAPVAV
jgi:hypothetical protein